MRAGERGVVDAMALPTVLDVRPEGMDRVIFNAFREEDLRICRGLLSR